MPAWITIYMPRDPSPVTVERLRKGISQADWWTLGEDFGVERSDADRFMNALKWSESPLSFFLEGQRAVRIHIWTDPDRVSEELEELRSPPASVKRRLLYTSAVVALEMGGAQLRTMHEVVGFEVAYWLSEKFDGLICDPSDKWYDHDEFRWSPIGS